MTSRERKIARLRRLVSEINDDLRAVISIVGEITKLAKEVDAGVGPVPARDIMAMAAYLHHFYTGVEAIFSRISNNIDGGPGQAADWHRELLRSMTIDIPGVRPRVISPEVAEELDEYRRFRHLFRHVYAGELRWKKMNHLAENLPTVFTLVENSLKEFNSFLLRLASSFEDS